MDTRNNAKVDLSSFNNDWYRPGGNPLGRLLWYFVNVAFFINPLNPSSGAKVMLLRWFGAKVGKGVVIKPAVNIKYPWNLEIGNYSWIGERVWIDCLDKVSIGANVCISQGALVLSGNHNYKSTQFDLMVKPIMVEDGAWVGAMCTVCQGVTVGSHAVLTVGSVAASDLGPYSINKGNPAVKIKERKIA
ncbi:MAG: WcaF family extracellular polysaccharide biosynthesis acetyltransferase [Salibacteraceae bacterium]